MPWQLTTLTGAEPAPTLVIDFGGLAARTVLPASVPRICEVQYSGLTSGTVLLELAASSAATDDMRVVLQDVSARSFVYGPKMVPRNQGSLPNTGLPWQLYITRGATDAAEIWVYWEWYPGGPS